jgi:hypothetical protein
LTSGHQKQPGTERREISSCPRLDAASPRRIEASASRDIPRRQEFTVLLRDGDSLTLLRRIDRRFIRLAIGIDRSFSRPPDARCGGSNLVHGFATRIVSRCFDAWIFRPCSRRCGARHGGTPFAFRIGKREKGRGVPDTMPDTHQ